MSIVCEAFTCTPAEAERQPWPLVEAVLEYRQARDVVELMKRGEDGAKSLKENPGLLRLIDAMHRAQVERGEGVRG